MDRLEPRPRDIANGLTLNSGPTCTASHQSRYFNPDNSQTGIQIRRIHHFTPSGTNVPKYHEISEAVAAGQQRRHQYRDECFQFARHQIDGLARHLSWPHELIFFAQPGVPKESHEWRPTLTDSTRMEDGELSVSLRFETQRGHRIFSKMTVRKLDDLFVVTIAGISRAIPAKEPHAPDFWNAVSVVLKTLAETEVP
jgi:hypothetical protein